MRQLPALVLLCVLVVAVGFAKVVASAVRTPAPQVCPVVEDWRPNITHCHGRGDVSLWDCIRQPGMYREDI